MHCEHSRPWKTVATYGSYEEAVDHGRRLVDKGFIKGDTTKIKRVGPLGLRYAVKTTNITTVKAKAKAALKTKKKAKAQK
ncbi:MAG TPA: hypothetical protein EYG51_22175 [Pseudomonadales bacterium]|nr:hypothetical protein [Pseudomonadales bacterium]